MIELFLVGTTTVLGYLYWQTRAELQDKYDRLTDRDERGRFVK